jgi:DNA replication protein DnaC
MDEIKRKMEELKITLEETTPENGNSSKDLKTDPIKAIVNGLPKRFKDCGLKTFIQNDSNKGNYGYAMSYIREELDKYSAVFFGNCGLGKTHLAIAIAKNLRPIVYSEITGLRYTKEQLINKDYGIYYAFSHPPIKKAQTNFINADEYFVRCNEVTFNKESKITYVKELLRWELLILDDLSLANMTDAKNENLYLLINTAYLDCRNIIITTNATLQQLKHYDVRIFSRLAEMCHFQEFSGQDWRMK